MGRVVACLALACIVFACAHGVSYPAPPVGMHVVLDGAFTDDEREAVVEGAEFWVAAIGPDVSFWYSTAPRAELDLAPGRAANELHVIRLSTMADLAEPCLLQSPIVGCYADGRVYLAADTLTSNVTANALRTISCHEVGHALGLAHSDPPSVMTPALSDMTPKPTWLDVYQFCNLRGCPRHESADASFH